MQTLKLDLARLRFALQSSCRSVTIILLRTDSDQGSKAGQSHALQELWFLCQWLDQPGNKS